MLGLIEFVTTVPWITLYDWYIKTSREQRAVNCNPGKKGVLGYAFIVIGLQLIGVGAILYAIFS